MIVRYVQKDLGMVSSYTFFTLKRNFTNFTGRAGQMDVRGTIDGVSVSDLVLRDVVDPREIPEVTFADDVLVLGDVITTGTDFQAELDSFLNEVIKPSSDGTIENNLRFTGAVTIQAEVNIGTLNGIPSDTWVISGSDTPQNIAVKTVFTQD